MRIVVSGVGIAGPTLAYWLNKSGHQVLLVERWPHLRRGGYIVDFWGVGYEIAAKMGLLPRLIELSYPVREARFVDRHGNKTGGFEVEALRRLAAGHLTSLPRADLATSIHEALDGKVETIFGDSITMIEEGAKNVRVSFERAAPRLADLVIGADGLHSRVRELVFGPEADFEVKLGYHVAAFEAAGYRPREELVYFMHNIPGRQLSRFTLRNDRTMFLFILRDEYLPATDKERKSLLKDAFAEAGWETPAILSALETAEDLYFDSVSQIRMESWAKGRVALIGDAAACVSLLAGEGSGLAVAEAYVLAGELQACGGDYTGAFNRYQERLKSFVEEKQKTAAKFGSSTAPKSALGIGFRDVASRLLRVPFLANALLGRNLRDDFTVPDYTF